MIASSCSRSIGNPYFGDSGAMMWIMSKSLALLQWVPSLLTKRANPAAMTAGR